jgi:myosin heavy subunit
VVKHTPKEIEYQAASFREKNKDYLREDLVRVLSQSKNTDIANLFPMALFQRSESSKTLNQKFRK